LRIKHPGRWIGTGLFVVGLLVAAFVVRVFDESGTHRTDHPEYPPQYAVQMFPDQGRDHIPGATIFPNYNSNPPTSGPHGPAFPWGVSAAPVPKESAVHNMEHGGVVVWYNCDGGPQPLDEPACDRLLTDLSAIVGPRVEDGIFVLMTPYTGTENRISLTAWQYLDAFDEVDEVRIQAFIDSFECRFDPEGACG
jgi:uncharacterized protein DUF3105